MARLESQAKMGYYPTPESTLQHIKNKLSIPSDAYLLDPCCGEGNALCELPNTFGIEVDTARAIKAKSNLNAVVCASIYETIIRPLESFSMLYLNPPYDWEDKRRAEYLFLKHSSKWLKEKGLLIFIVPDYIVTRKEIVKWISRQYSNIQIYKFTREDYPKFKQVVLFATKEESNSVFPMPPYRHIEDTSFVINVPSASPPDVFEQKAIDIKDYDAKKIIIETLCKITRETTPLSPLFPLRKGHLVSLLMSGVLNGELNNSLVFKCFTERRQKTRTEKTKEITTNTYVSGIRVIERGHWYDVI